MTVLGVFGRLGLKLAAALSTVALLSAAAPAQELPQQLTIVVPYAAGGPGDIAARLIFDKVQAQSGKIVVIENRDGGGGIIGATRVKDAPADGSTVLFSGAGMLTILPHVQQNLPFDPRTQLMPVSGLALADTAFVVNPSVPANTLAEFIALAKESSPPIAMASGGVGTTTHLYLELLADEADFQYLHVPYRGSGPALADVIAGTVAGTATGLVTIKPQIEAGKLRALAVIGNERSPIAPEIPSTVEAGVPSLAIKGWWGLMAPLGTPAELVEAWEAAIARAVSDQEVVDKLAELGIVPWAVTAAELAATAKDEDERWGTLIRERNITSQ